MFRSLLENTTFTFQKTYETTNPLGEVVIKRISFTTQFGH